MAGQTINDRLLAARHSLAGQGLAKSVCKATTEEMIGPKKKHLDCKYSCFALSSNEQFVLDDDDEQLLSHYHKQRMNVRIRLG